MVRRLSAILFAFLTALVMTATATLPANAAVDDPEIKSMHLEGALDKNGRLNLTMDVTMRFNGTQHGPYFVFGQYSEIPNDPDHYLRSHLYVHSIVSPTGASAMRKREEEGGAYVLKIGNEDKTVDGEHRYIIEYTLTGLVFPKDVGDFGPETYTFDWRVIAPGAFNVPIEDFSAHITIPTGSSEPTCYSGESGSLTPCEDFTATESSLSVAAHLPADEGIRITANYPKKSFDGVPLNLVPRRTWTNVWGLTPETGLASGAILAGGLGAVLALARRARRDERYLGLPPGVPPTASNHPTGRVATPTIPVSFTRLTEAPGLLGTLIDGSADFKDVVATLLDLARRGIIGLRVEEKLAGKDDYVLTLLTSANDESMTEWEKDFVAMIFGLKKTEICLSKEGERFGEASIGLMNALDAEMVTRGWFRASPRRARGRWNTVSVLLTLAAIGAGIWVFFTYGPLIIPIAVAIVGVAIGLNSKAAAVRTADGSVINDQLVGFRDYVLAAEAGQIQVGEAAGYFDELLPLAVALGVESQWEKACREANTPDAQPITVPGWLGAGVSLASISSDMTSAITSSISAVTSSSSSSGGGGGGVSGGGGSMGGGAW